MTLWADRRLITLKIWNTLNLTDLPRLHASYYDGAKGVILAYSVADRKSFDRMQYWASVVRQETSSAKVVLIGTKTDLKRQREVSYCEGVALAEQLEAPFLETSSKDTFNVNQAFYLLMTLVNSCAKTDSHTD